MERQKGLATLIIVLLVTLAIGGYLIYQKQFKPVTVPQVVTKSTPAPTPIATNSAETANPDSIGVNWKTYTSPKYNPFYTDKQLEGVTPENILEKLGGGYANPENIKKVSFSIMLPEGWQVTNDKIGLKGKADACGDAFIFTKDNLEIKIKRCVAPEGNLCDKDFAGYGNNYKDIKINSMTLRRIKDFENTAIPKGYIGFTLCQGTGTSFVSNTSLGKISFTLPKDYNPSDLDLMDKIISTLQKVQ